MAALVGIVVGGLGSSVVVLGVTTAGVALGPAPQATSVTALGPGASSGPDGAAASGTGGDTPLLSAAALAAAQGAAAACPGLDWTLLAAGAAVDGALGTELGPIAAGLCPLPPGRRPAALAADLPSPTQGEVALVLSVALGDDPALRTDAALAITFAAANLGAPYRWGGTGAGGFDCSGLTQAAYRAAGVSIPRVAQDQYDAGPAVAPGAALEPGDLVFFGQSAFDVSHVGLYIGGGDMIDAPHTGAFVRVEPTPTSPGAPFGSDLMIGATRPAP